MGIGSKALKVWTKELVFDAIKMSEERSREKNDSLQSPAAFFPQKIKNEETSVPSKPVKETL